MDIKNAPEPRPVQQRQSDMSLECPACSARDIVIAAEVDNVPVHVGVLWPSAEAARQCPRGFIRLAFCTNCGFLFNATFDEGLVDYGLSYDNALHFSSVFQEYELDLAQRLVERYQLYKKLIVEIGCGSAHFLGLLSQLGDNRGLGFDPSHEPEQLDELAMGRVEVRRQLFDEASAAAGASLLCARHLLEHIAEPRKLLESLRRSLEGGSAILYFEVPNALLILERLSVWDLMYEHCGYFTSGSLERIFGTTGFEVIEVAETYGGQFVGIEARVANTHSVEMAPAELAHMSSLVAAFSDHFEGMRRVWNERLVQFGDQGKKVVVWGAGGKGVSFMNFLGEAHRVDSLVDVNPRKQGMYLAGTGHEILAPEALIDRLPDVVVVMNPLYEDEITAHVRSLGMSGTSIVTLREGAEQA
jgi:SAM-dependent methyltransferase